MEDAGLNHLMMHFEVRGDAILFGQIDTEGCVVEYCVWYKRWENVDGVEVDNPGMLVTEAANLSELLQRLGRDIGPHRVVFMLEPFSTSSCRALPARERKSVSIGIVRYNSLLRTRLVGNTQYALFHEMKQNRNEIEQHCT
jgi:hypothetical protein